MFEYANVCVCVCPLQHRVTDVPTTSVSMIQLVPAIMELPWNPLRRPIDSGLIEMAWLLLDTNEISRCLAGCWYFIVFVCWALILMILHEISIIHCFSQKINPPWSSRNPDWGPPKFNTCPELPTLPSASMVEGSSHGRRCCCFQFAIWKNVTRVW